MPTYEAAPAVSYSAAPAMSYAAAPVSYAAAPVTYSSAPQAASVQYAAAPVQYAAAPAMQVAQAEVKAQIGQWLICQDAMGEFYQNSATGQQFDQAPAELIQLIQAQ